MRPCLKQPDRQLDQRKHRILVVDDHPGSVEAICLLLKMLGHETRAATSGHDALIEAARFDPDIVLLDLVLPDLSGFQVARMLRGRATGPLHIAAISGWGTGEHLVRTFAAGFDQHVLKPANLAIIEAIIRRADAKLAEPLDVLDGRADQLALIR